MNNKVQIGTSDEADFEKNTWTFTMEPGFRVSAGRFAILPESELTAPATQPQEPVVAVTLESVRQALEHLEQHNGPGRKREALAMLTGAPVAAQQPKAYILHAVDGDRLVWSVGRGEKSTPLAVATVPTVAAQQQDDTSTPHLVPSNLETDIARRLRQHATNLNLSQDLRDALSAGANEADRFYKGMLAWKRTAEAKDAARPAQAPQQEAGQARELPQSILDDLDFEPSESFAVADMANVGYSLMQAIKAHRPDYSWSESPAEIVGDLAEELYELRNPPLLPKAAQSSPVVPGGFAIVPLKPNAAMQSVMDEEGWQWEDLLAAANAITEEQYNALASAPAQPTVPERWKPMPAEPSPEIINAIAAVLARGEGVAARATARKMADKAYRTWYDAAPVAQEGDSK